MRVTPGRGTLWCLLGMSLLLAAPQAEASVIVNGDFSAGLTGWSVQLGDGSIVNDPTGVAAVAGGQVTLQESATSDWIALFQVFTIPNGATTLSFNVGTNPDNDGADLPDALNVSLLNSLGTESLVPTVGTSDNFFTQDLVTGGLPQRGNGVTLSPASGSLPLNVSLDVSSLAGATARIEFRLISGSTDPGTANTTVTLDDVVVASETGPPAVPEPSTFVIFSLLLGGLGLGRRLQSRRRRTGEPW